MKQVTPCCNKKVKLNDGQRLIRCPDCQKIWNTYTARGVTHFKEPENAS